MPACLACHRIVLAASLGLALMMVLLPRCSKRLEVDVSGLEQSGSMHVMAHSVMSMLVGKAAPEIQPDPETNASLR
jgi:hypothetical protein